MPFSLTTFANAVGPDLFAAFARHCGIAVDVSTIPVAGRGGFGRHLHEAVAKLPQTDRDLIEAALSRCERLNDFIGDNAMFAAAERAPALKAQLDGEPNTRSRALTLFLADGAAFQEAEFRWHAAHYRRTKYWSRFRIRADEIPIGPLGHFERAELKQAFRNAHPDGRAIEIEAAAMSGEDNEILVAIFSSAPASEAAEFEDEALTRRRVTRVLTTTLVFNPRTKILEIAGVGWRTAGREALAELFVEHGLGIRVDATTIGPDPLRLQPLAAADTLSLDPDDQLIESVAIDIIRFPSPTARSKGYTIELLPGESHWSAIAADLGADAARRLRGLQPTFMRLRVTEPRPRSGGRSVTYDVSLHANGKTNLRETTPAQLKILNTYLERWGARDPNQNTGDDVLDLFEADELFRLFEHGGSTSTQRLCAGLGAAFDALIDDGVLRRANDATLWAPPGGGSPVHLTRDPETDAFHYFDENAGRVVVSGYDPSRVKLNPSRFARAVARVARGDQAIEMVERFEGILWEARKDGEVLARPLFVAREVASSVRWEQCRLYLERPAMPRGDLIALLDGIPQLAPPSRFNLIPLERVVRLGPSGLERAPGAIAIEQAAAPPKPGRPNSGPRVEQAVSTLEARGVTAPTQRQFAELVHKEIARTAAPGESVPTARTIGNKLRQMGWRPRSLAS